MRRVRTQIGWREPKHTLAMFGRRLLLSVFLGAAASFGVAWILGVLPRYFDPGIYQFSYRSAARGEERVAFNTYDYRWYGVLERQYSVNRWNYARNATPETIGQIPIWWGWTPGTGFPNYVQTWDALVKDFAAFEKAQGPGVDLKYSVTQAGWPAMCVQSTAAVDMQPNPTVITRPGILSAQTRHGIGLEVTSQTHAIPMARNIIFPYQPIWSGLLINTVFYSLIFWFILSIKRAYRHARRMRRGQCPICAYNLAYDLRAGCPECGWHKDQTIHVA